MSAIISKKIKSKLLKPFCYKNFKLSKKLLNAILQLIIGYNSNNFIGIANENVNYFSLYLYTNMYIISL